MKKVKMIDSRALLNKQLKNKEFKKEYDGLKEEFELAGEIIKLRLAANMTQRQLARFAGTSQPAISRLESGEYRNLSLSFLRKVGKVLGMVPKVHFEKI